MLRLQDFPAMEAKFARITELNEKAERYSVSGGGGTSFYSFLLANLFSVQQRHFLVVLPNEEVAERFFQDISAWVGLNIPGLSAESLKFLPSPELFAVKEEQISMAMFERVNIFAEIALSVKPLILITQPSALLKKIPPLQRFAKNITQIKPGTSFRRDLFPERLLEYGYSEADVVEEPGEFARRGGIVDIFPLNSQFPLRVEFAGNKINSVRRFETGTQLSFEKLQDFSLYPLSELFVGEATEDVIGQMKDSRIFFIEPALFYRSPIYRELKSRGLYEERDFERINKRAILLQDKEYGATEREVHFHFNIFATNERFHAVPFFIWNSFPDENICVFSDNPGQESRLKEILKEKRVKTSRIQFLMGALTAGFSYPEINLTILSNDELFSRYSAHRPALRRYAESIPLGSYSEIKEGDYVVHYDEGIGRFRGMQKIATGSEEVEEFAQLEYAGGDNLYVPLNQIYLIHKYIGNSAPRLSTLAGKGWIKVRDRVKNAIRDLAGDLYSLYSERKKEKGFAFLPDEEIQQEFDAGFIYKETADQLKAIRDVKKDMVSSSIMDRLICGDSGYGKTEVALRAACKAVISGTQTAVLVPTTVLALQHFLSFKERFADFPVRVEMLSRLVSPGMQKRILSDIKSGKVDIVVGTHRLLQKDVKFHRLGLLVIDEEQRFGVVHKEKMKRIFKKIDVLTLTATPIPRTLYMSISGLRDISVIETPPRGRLSVVTYAGRYDANLIKEAITRELERKGQVFYLHNFVYDIEKVKARLSRMIPFARIETAHGKMAPERLSGIMKRFSEGEIDILVATTIVENGIDIPRANTLIVDNAHRFGLSDLYQLRGRIGRYKWRAYAYFLMPDHLLSVPAVKSRLTALQEMNKPGSGYKVALKDLEIRGAGNILGREQHGFIEQVGFNLYCRFWNEVTGEIKGRAPVIAATERATVRIPPGYVKSSSLRFYLYKRISNINSESDVKELLNEMQDRFGRPPEELVTTLKLLKF